MKFVLHPKRRLAALAESRIVLFPFLAVLICTMGALIPLLMAITSIAKTQAESAAAAKAAEQTADARRLVEDARWRIEMLRQSREKTEAQLADARLQLGHLEDHERRLREEFERHRNTLANLDRDEPTERRESETEGELRRVRGEIDAAARRLDDTRKQAAARKPSYAIIPYEGPNQTNRRPIYIECRADAVVLQPEGIELNKTDFDGPLGPGNPLAAAMRAAREYMLERPNFDAKAGEPYPLLLVRPDGINAYYAAREAMTSWGSDFGYELIGADWKLAFPPPDPRLAQVLGQVVSSARASQSRLAAAAPAHRNIRGNVVYRAAPGGGGFIREEAPADSTSESYRSVSPAGPVAGNAAYASKYSAAGNADYATVKPETGDASDSQQRPATAVAGGAYGDSSASPTPGDSTASNPLRGTGGADSRARQGVPSAENNAPPEGYIVGRPPREQPSSDRSANGSADRVAGRTLRPGEWEPTPDPPPKPKDDQTDDLADKKEAEGPKPPSLAGKRGEDWGLRDAARGSVGIRRPVRVECHPDRIIVLSDRDPSGNKVVPLGARVESSIDTLISAVWEQMESWGIAGRSMYWRPVLTVSVAPGAQRRFEELAALLEGSGMLVEKK